ncbi:MAG: hypothetical protein ACYCO9_21735 [Streptosporangiaceae bacterium]
MVKPGTVAAAIGVGLAAGVAGTAAMTVSSTIEMMIRGRPASSAPAQAASKVLGVEPRKKRFGTIVHWIYGTSWGAVRGVLGVSGLAAPQCHVDERFPGVGQVSGGWLRCVISPGFGG